MSVIHDSFLPGFPIHEGYGQSESTLMCAKMPGMEVRPGSMGKPAPGYRLKVRNSNFRISYGCIRIYYCQ